MKEKHNYTYMVLCRDGSLYTGWTTDIDKRIEAHNSGKGAKYTRNRGPVELRYLEESGTKEEAMQKEAAYKKLTRKQKDALIDAQGRKRALLFPRFSLFHGTPSCSVVDTPRSPGLIYTVRSAVLPPTRAMRSAGASST